MNDIVNITSGQSLTMSSREMAELCEKRHDSVKRTIDTLADSGVIVRPQIVDEQNIDAMGRPRSEKVYLVGKRDSYIVVAQLSPEFTARLVDRWQELEEQAKSFDPIKMLNDPAAMRGILLTYTEKVIELESRVEEMREDVAAYEHLTDASGSFSLTEAAKNLGVAPQVFTKWLKTNGWTYRRAGAKNDLGYQSKVSTGMLDHKVTTGPRPDGTEWISTQVRVTAKGLAFLAKAFPKAASAA